MTLRTVLFSSTMLLTTALAAASAHAYDLGEYGKITGDFRYRYEYVDQDSLPDKARAQTARMRLGYMTPTWQGLTGYVEGESIVEIDDHYNNGHNGRTTYPRVGDPADLAFNQLYLSYALPGKNNNVTVGRQYLNFDNQRWIGWSKFRQNDATFDAARIALAPTDKMTVDYAYSISSHRSAGSRQSSGDFNGDMHMIHADYKLPYDLKLAGYGYWLDLDPYIATLASKTFGARAEWRPKKEWVSGITPLATAEFAKQSDMGANPRNYDEWYHWLELGGSYKGYSLTGVFEHLGGNGVGSVTMPMSSLHTFNGWVDKFGTTPVNGLNDYFLTFKAPIGLPWEGQKLGFETQLHQYDSDVNDQDYGKEIDIGFTYTPIENHTILAQVGRYYADDFSDDTTKAWLAYEFKF